MVHFLALLQFFTCSSTVDFSATVIISEKIPTVIQIDIASEAPYTFWIEARSETHYWQTQTSENTNIPRFILLGLPQNQSLEITIYAQDQEGNTHQQIHQTQTGTLSAHLGHINLETSNPASLSGYFLGTLFSDPGYLVLFDTAGNILWGIEHGDEEHGGIDSVISQDGASLYYNIFLKDKEEDDGHIVQVNWMGDILNEIRTPQAHHMFTLLPDSSLAYIALDQRETEEYGPVCGDKIIRRYPNGTEEIIHSTWDSIELYETSSWDFGLYPFCRDWTHGNFLQYNQQRNSFLFSTAGPDVILELSESGEVLHRFGGVYAQENPWEYSSEEEPFSYPHGIHWGTNGELMMISTVDDQSTAVAYHLNDSNQVLETVWRWGAEYQYKVLHLGEVIDYSENLRMVNWGSIGHLQMLNSADDLLWESYSNLGSWFAQVDYLPTLPGMHHVAAPLQLSE